MLSSFFQSQTDLSADWSLDFKSANTVAIHFLDKSKFVFFSGVEISLDQVANGLHFDFSTRQANVFSSNVLKHFETCDLANLSLALIDNVIESRKLQFNRIVAKAVSVKSFLKTVAWDDGLSDVISQPMTTYIDRLDIEILADIGGVQGEYTLTLNLSHDVDNWCLSGEIKVVFGGQAFDVSSIGNSQIAQDLKLDLTALSDPNNNYLHTWEYQKSPLYVATCEFFLECLALCENHYCSFL